MKEGLKRAVEIIDDEMDFAKQVNPQMAFGMQHIRKVILEELEENINGK